MKTLRTVLVATTMACTMTTGVFAATCPTTTGNSTNPTTCQRQLLNCKNSSLSDFCKNLDSNDCPTDMLTAKKITKSAPKNCLENNNKDCNASEIKGKNNEKRSVKKSTCQKPVVKTPFAKTPVVEAPVVEAPVVDAPVIEAPVVEAPVVEAPVVEAPVVEAPVVETPSNENITSAQFLTEVVRLVNVERTKVGLNKLSVDAKIQAAAYIRSTEQQQQFSHTRPNGTSCFTALAEQGVSYRGAGENIAMGQKNPAEVMNAWMNSEGHRANILKKEFTNIGIGYYVNNGTAYWTQMFTY